MKKSDLKNGMEVVLRNGKHRLFFNDNFYIINKVNNELEKTTNICLYSDELTNWDEDWDIIKVYYEGVLVWERHNETDWTKVPFGAKVRAWDEDCYGKREFEVEGKFLGYEENKYGDEPPSLPFLIYYEDETGIDTGWFQYCKLIEED